MDKTITLTYDENFEIRWLLKEKIKELQNEIINYGIRIIKLKEYEKENPDISNSEKYIIEKNKQEIKKYNDLIIKLEK